eukprot:jgi/Psemu1/24890/gm1.24890_g
MTPGLSPVADSHQEEIKTNDGQPVYPHWNGFGNLSHLVVVCGIANALWLNGQFDVPGRGPEDPPWTKLHASTTNLPPEERNENKLLISTMGPFRRVGKQVIHGSPTLNSEASWMRGTNLPASFYLQLIKQHFKASAKKFIKRMVTMVKKEEKNIPAAPELPIDVAHGRREGLHAWLNGNLQCVAPGDQFPILLPHDLDYCLVDDKKMEDEDTQIFKNPRNGDHLMTSFQWKTCIWHATLDAFWSRKRSTVAKKYRELACFFDFQAQLRTDLSCLPPQGPIPTEDSWGMKVACAMLLRSQDEGGNAPCVQFETVREFHSAFTNFIHTCPEGVGAHLTLQRRGSDVWLPDAPVTLEIMDGALDYMEKGWKVMELSVYE